MKKVILILLFTFMFSVNVYADKRYNFIDGATIYLNGDKVEELNDNNYYTILNIKANDTIELFSPKSIKSVYIIYSLNAKTGNISYFGNWQMVGANGFIHEYIELDGKTKNFDLTYKEDVTIKEIFVFDGETPDWVEKWEKPHEDADILLFSTHGDDEHLFFAGLIPKMVADGKKMQVVYLVSHANKPIRYDEQLNGLWEAGLRNYPVFGVVKDEYAFTLKQALNNLNKTDLTLDDVIRFEVENIRRFKPEVVVTHDEKGEYGHGQHCLTTYALENAIKYLNDDKYISDYEPFEPYKIYIHLYKDNKITMDYDIPLEYFDGKTAFRVSMNAFAKHETQQHIKYGKWQYLDNAKEISEYSPLYYGLYYSTVGYENEDNNMFYNIPEKPAKDDEEENREPVILPDSISNEDNLHYTSKFILMILVVILLILNIIVLILKRKKRNY